MKKLLFITIAILLTSSAWSTNYWFSDKDGNDANPTCALSTPWQTPAKFRTIITSLVGGDTVFFHNSCTFDEFYAVINNIDGSYDNEIVFTSYGNGRRSVLKGTTDYSGGLSVSGDLYSISGDSDIGDRTWPNAFRQIWIDTVYYAPSRYPNIGMLQTSGGDPTYIGDVSQSWSSNDHIGGVAVGYFTAWEWTQGLISSNTSNRLNVSPSFSYEDGSHSVSPSNGEYYFVQGSPSTTATDLDGENYFEDDGFTILWSADNLNSGHKVECTTVDTMWHITDCEYLKFENLIFEKVNQYTFVLDDCENITINNCGLNWSNGGHIRAEYIDTLTIENNFFHETQNSVMHLDYCGMVSIRHNDFKNITVREGLRNLNTRYNSCLVNAYATDSIVYQYNDHDTVASISNMHYSSGDPGDYSVLFDKNVGTHYGWVDLGDNAAFYNGGEWDSDIKKIYSNNILVNSKNNRENYYYGTSTSEFIHAFYNDYNSARTQYLNNTVFNSNQFIYVNGGDPGSGNRLRFENNLTYNGTKDMNDQWASLIHLSNAGGNGYPRNDTILNNTFVFGNNTYEMAYTVSDYGNPATLTGMDWDYNSFLDLFTFENEEVYRCVNSYTVNRDYNISELCGNQNLDCNSTFNYINWDYSDVSETYSESEFVINTWNGEEDDWYFNLGSCTVKDAETGTNYSDSILIPAHDGKVLLMVSGTRSTIGDTSNWIAPVTWYEELNDTTLATGDDDECLYYISVNDTSVTIDSVGYYFENNLNTEYGDYDLNYTGTETYTGIGNCQGSYSYYPDDQSTVYTDQVDLGDDFEARLCYYFWGSNTGTILANRSTGSGWELNRGVDECLEFITHDGTNYDTIQSAAAVIGTDGQQYEVEIIVDVDGGTVSMIVDDTYVTPIDSVIQSDFNVDASIYIGCDAGGANDMWGSIDRLHIEWSDTVITEYDSCVTGEFVLDTISAFDTTYFKDYNYLDGEYSAVFYDSDCGDTVVYIDRSHLLIFYNIDFGTTGVNYMELSYNDNIPSDEMFGFVNDVDRSRVGTFISEPGNGCMTIDIKLTKKLTGVQNLYFYGVLTEAPTSGWLHWFRFYDLLEPNINQWRLPSQFTRPADPSGRWILIRN